MDQPRGIGGEVYFTRPGAACYGCIAASTNPGKAGTARPATLDYNHLSLAELRSTCALNLDIEQIALLQARVAIGMLMNDPRLTGLLPNINFMVFTNHGMPEPFARPLHTTFFSLERNPHCLNCGVKPANAEVEAERILASL